MNDIKFYAPIEKTDDEQRMVYGYASTEAVDSQGEIVKKDALKAALDDYMKYANIREMHQPSAVGKTKKANIDDKGMYIAAKVVDDNAWKKVKEGVYTGFSIGGRVKTMIDNEITGLGLSEISLVDRPANPEAMIDMYKVYEAPKEAPKEKTEVKKSMWEADWLLDLALSLNSYIVNQKYEGNTDTADLEAALMQIKQAAIIEIGEDEQYPQVIVDAVEMAEKTLGLEKRNQSTILTVATNTHEQIVETKGAADTNMKQDVKANLTTHTDNKGVTTTIITNGSPEYVPQGSKAVADMPTNLEKGNDNVASTTTTPDASNADNTDVQTISADKTVDTTTNTTIVTSADNVTVDSGDAVVPESNKAADEEPEDILKTIDVLIKKGEMPTDEQITEMLKTMEIEATDKAIKVAKYEIAGKIIAYVEKSMIEQANKDAVLDEAKKVVAKAELTVAKDEKEANDFEKAISLIEKLGAELKKEDAVYTPNDAPSLSEAEESPEAHNETTNPDLERLKDAVNTILMTVGRGSLTPDEEEKLSNGVKAGSTITGSGHFNEDAQTNLKTQMVNDQHDGNVQGKAEETTDLNKLEGMTQKIAELEEKLAKIEAQPMPVLAKASYVAVEKFETSGNEYEAKLAEVDEVAKLLNANPFDQSLQKRAQDLQVEIMRLGRAQRGSSN